MFYPKVLMSNAQLPQMKSDCQQAPFYFGGSQVPVAITTRQSVAGSGFKLGGQKPTAILLRNLRK